MLYRVGARDEVTGKTGLAHFLEHMAFRDSENFPGTDLVGRIYAEGGEWHGYTWIDQTTYFETVPKEDLDLLLRIEADRMSALLLRADDMEAERGSVLAEMHMYENDPGTRLIDAVNFTVFLGHPYRNNTIGWESDIQKLEHRDVVEFYEQHYHPANAVIAVVGDLDAGAVRKRIGELFGGIEGREPTPLPRTVEPVQDGVRRIVLNGDAGSPQFRIAYRAPSANDPDFAAFLVLQAMLGASSGANFLQNDWGTPIGDTALLAGAADELTTWYPPSAQEYVFIVGGYAPDGAEPGPVESAIEARIRDARELVADSEVVAAAIDEVLDELAFDVETTEDAAHQLAYFDGLGALNVLLELPARVGAVTAGDVQRTARRYLKPEQRSIAWYLPADGSSDENSPVVKASAGADAADEPRLSKAAQAPAAPGRVAAPPPTVLRLAGGLPALLQPSDLSSSVQLRVVTDAAGTAGADADEPVTGHASFTTTVRPEELQAAVEAAGRALAGAKVARTEAPSSLLPEWRLEEEFAALLETAPANGAAPRPVLVALAGDFDPVATRGWLESAFDDAAPAPGERSVARALPREPQTIRLHVPIAQAQLGYVATAPGPREAGADAWRLLLYILSHGYEGRLGKKAIGESGLVYYIETRYRSDGDNAWVTLASGVDPHKLDAFRSLMLAEIARLASEPPTKTEVEEAKAYFLGRRLSGAQSNDELTQRLATEWLWYGELLSYEALEQRLARVGRDDVVAAARAFAAGTTITVSE